MLIGDCMSWLSVFVVCVDVFCYVVHIVLFCAHKKNWRSRAMRALLTRYLALLFVAKRFSAIDAHVLTCLLWGFAIYFCMPLGKLHWKNITTVTSINNKFWVSQQNFLKLDCYCVISAFLHLCLLVSPCLCNRRKVFEFWHNHRQTCLSSVIGDNWVAKQYLRFVISLS